MSQVVRLFLKRLPDPHDLNEALKKCTIKLETGIQPDILLRQLDGETRMGTKLYVLTIEDENSTWLSIWNRYDGPRNLSAPSSVAQSTSLER